MAGRDGYEIVDGVALAKFFQTNRTMRQQVDAIRDLDMRTDDVIICAYAKCGTHWLWETASMLRSGRAAHHPQDKEFSMMEAQQIELICDQPSPRTLNTHLPVTMLPAQVKGKKVKIISVYRNAKDVLVSLLFHIRQIPGRDALTLDDVISRIYDGEAVKGSYVKCLQAMDAFIKDNPDHPVFNISFEETKADPLGVVTRLAEFLGVKASPEFCAEVVQATSFKNMKQADSSKEQLKHMHKVQMYRKGEVGDWKNHMTVAQSERVDVLLKHLEGCDFRFRYTL